MDFVSRISIAVLLAAGLATGIRAQGPAAETDSGRNAAAALMFNAGINGGLCSFPRIAAGDESLAFAIAARSNFVVHVFSTDEKLLAGFRNAAEKSGLLGRSLSMEKGDCGKLPYADRLVDVMVVTDLKDADLTPERRAEWCRVLAPRRGTALLGRSKESGSGLSESALKAWVKDLPLSKIVADESGVWVLLKTDLPAGSDAWTHRLHDADNAQSSADTTLKAPFLAQWWDGPGKEGFWGTTVVSGNGRMFLIRSPRAGGMVRMTARSLTSGVILWDKSLGAGYVSARDCAAVSGDVLWLIRSNGVVRLQGETGVELGFVAGPLENGQIKWMACADDKLAVLAGDPDIVRQGNDQVLATNPVGRVLAVYATATGRELWKETLSGQLDQRLVAVCGGRLYSLIDGVGLTSRDLATGKVLWTNADKDIQAQLAGSERKFNPDNFLGQSALLALDEVVILRTMWAKEMFAVSAADGALLWRKPAAPMAGTFLRTMYAVPVNGMWVSKAGCFDLKTGQPAKGPKFIASRGCAFTTATPNYLIAGFGGVQDIQADKQIRLDDLKSTCDSGTIVSEGIMVSVPSQCGCLFELMNCYRALASGSGFEPHSAPPWTDRLNVIDAMDPAVLEMAPADWLQFRHDGGRSGATPATVGKDVKKLWSWVPAGSKSAVADAAQAVRASAPVTADGFVWFVSADGIVRCLKAAGGEEVWRYPLAAAVDSGSLALGAGCLLAGSNDGRLYCLDATTGKCRWIARLAPADRRVMRFGKLVSTWPVTGVAVQDGVGYATAGLQKGNGVHAYAFDIKSGSVVWEKHDAGGGLKGNLDTALSFYGPMALGNGRMWTPGMACGSFDLKTGSWKNGIGNLCNQAVVFGEKWILNGGGKGVFFNSSLIFNGCPFMPSWDSELLVIPPNNGGRSVESFAVAKLLPWLDEVVEQGRTGKAVPGHQTLVQLRTWGSKPISAVAAMLAKDLVIVAANGEGGKPSHVDAYQRADGSLAWTQDLPGKPTGDLAIDRDGRVLVNICDGSVVCVGR